MTIRPHVLMAGGGVAGLDITVLAPEMKFVNRSMGVDKPSASGSARGLSARDLATDLGARWHRGSAARADRGGRRIDCARATSRPTSVAESWTG